MSPGQKKPYAVLPPALAGGPTTPFVTTIADAAAVENGLPPDYVHVPDHGRHGPGERRDRHAPPEPDDPPPWPVPAHAGHPLRRVRGEPGAPLLPDVAAARLQRDAGDRRQPRRLPERPLPLGRGHHRRRQQRRGAAGELHRRRRPARARRRWASTTSCRATSPYFKSLADTYAMSDNFHQSIEGGTGANHVALGTGLTRSGTATARATRSRRRPSRSRTRIPQAGTNNWYTQDGYSGGTYSNCSDSSAARRRSGRRTTCSSRARRRRTARRATTTCSTTTTRATSATARSTREPVHHPAVERRRRSATRSSSTTSPGATTATSGTATSPTRPGTDPTDVYCNICNPFQYATSIMTNADAAHDAHQGHDRPLRRHPERLAPGLLDRQAERPGRRPPGVVEARTSSRASRRRSSTWSRPSPTLWKDTAIIITFDEGGGYWDSGYVQPLDFFGDGTRIPAIVGVAVGHGRAHLAQVRGPRLDPEVRRAQLGPAAGRRKRSRDNLPNPIADGRQPVGPAQRAVDRRPLRRVQLRAPAPAPVIA